MGKMENTKNVVSILHVTGRDPSPVDRHINTLTVVGLDRDREGIALGHIGIIETTIMKEIVIEMIIMKETIIITEAVDIELLMVKKALLSF